MNKFMNSLNISAPTSVISRTDNGMRAFSTTKNANVDLFGSIGASRGKNIIPAFEAAMSENLDLGVRNLLWARDVRKGAGERQIFRDVLLHLEQKMPELLLQSRILDKIPLLGRFDDLLIFQTPEVKNRALQVYVKHLKEGNGLAAKWAPRKGVRAVELRNALGMTPKQYRKFIVSNTDVVEQDMCAKNWEEIDFEHVPSLAMTKYLKAFYRNAPEQFAAYKESLAKGEAKVNAGAVYPYQIIKMLGGARDLSHGIWPKSAYKFDQVAQSMWDALPDYMNGRNMIAVVDNSGSMTSRVPGSTSSMMDVATSLGLYAAERSKGAFKDLSIGFSQDAEFVQLSGPLHERLTQMCSAPWGGSTNLHSVFDLILRHAVSNRVPQSDMPEMVVILSDIQFDYCVCHDDSALGMIRRKYEDAGYDLPQVVFWNLNARGNVPVKFNESGTALVSGFSPALLESVLGADVDSFSPESVMLRTLQVDRYSW